MELVLPCLHSELEGPALRHIVEEISKVDYLNHVIIGLDRADEAQYRAAHSFFQSLKQPFSLLWNDGPRLQNIHSQLVERGLAPTEPGKGRNVWYCFGYMLAARDVFAIAIPAPRRADHIVGSRRGWRWTPPFLAGGQCRGRQGAG